MKKLLEVLKDISALLVGAAAFLYVLGYTVHLAYFRLLGIETVGQPLDYVRLAADYVASIVASLPQLLLAAIYYLPLLIRPPFLILTICCLGMIVLLILRWLSEHRRKDLGSVTKTRHLTFVALNIITIVALALLLRLEFDIAKVRNVLQTVDPADIQQMQNQLANPEVQKWDNRKLFDLKKKNVTRVYSKYMDAFRDTPGFQYWNEWFNPIASPGSSSNRNATYLALVLINLIVLIVASWELVWIRRSRQAQTDGSRLNTRAMKLKGYWTSPISIALSFGILIQVFIFPYIYATLGRSFVYPVVKLRVANDLHPHLQATENTDPSGTGENRSSNSTADIWTHGVFLVSESDIEVVVYDRLNFFQIKHVPKTRVLAMSQLFNASPFESCNTQEMSPCETLWIPEDTSTFDF